MATKNILAAMSSKKILVGITGLKQTGKDTAADYIVKNYGFTKRSFAEPLKEVCKTLFGFSEEQLSGNLKEIPDRNWHGITPRETMQFLGTDLFRNQMYKLSPKIHQNIFIQNFENWYEKNNNKMTVVPDVRFQNELDFIDRNDGIIIKISYLETKSFIGEYILKVKQGRHESENGNLDYGSFTDNYSDMSRVHNLNNGAGYSLERVYSQLDNIMAKLKIEGLQRPDRPLSTSNGKSARTESKKNPG